MNKVAPEEVGLSSSRLEHLQNVMQGYVDQGQVAGLSTLIARHGKVAHFECYGKMDIERNRPMQSDTIFRLASMTKPIVSVALLMLFEEGHFTLLDPVSKFIPEFANLKVFVRSSNGGSELADLEREITIQDLLRHTAGFIDEDLNESSPVAKMYKQAEFFGPPPLWQLQMPLEEMIRRLAELPLVNQPGQAWSYGVAADVVGYLVSLLADMPLDTFLQEKIFKPLGMVDTAFYVSSDKLDRLSSLYSYREASPLSLLDSSETSLLSDPNQYPCGSMGLVH